MRDNLHLQPENGNVEQAFFTIAGKRFLIVEVGAAAPTSIPSPIEENLPANPSAKMFESDSTSPKKEYVYGLQGLATLLNCSKSTAYNIKRSGKIDKAISQFGKTIVVDVKMALNLLRK